MKINLEDYKKEHTEREKITTGVSIHRHHKVFLEEARINLSAIVRDVLDEMIKEHKSKTRLKKTS